MTRGQQGYVYATTGQEYTILARRAARSLRGVSPDAQIDLFTDQDIDDPVFDRIHQLKNDWKFPKIEAMQRSRFRYTIMLDADTVILTDVSELFSMTREYTLSACLGYARPPYIFQSQRYVPRWVPVLNSGVLVFRQGRRIRRLGRAWANYMVRHQQTHDQPSLRVLIRDLRISTGIIPPEYNLIQMKALNIWEDHMAAPRILHVRALHQKPPGDPLVPIALRDVVSEQKAAMIEGLFAAEAQWKADRAPLHWSRRSETALRLLSLWKRIRY
jgi:hypothetical protein